ncbi:hypothetical protein Bbelb_302670 [Branchiostoma belcheri]|nr:hypothetical protein Bbelb_302670 [Branchiostoma belcheri]
MEYRDLRGTCNIGVVGRIVGQEAPEEVEAEISGLCANRAKLEAEVGDQTSTGPGQNQCTWEPEEKIVSPAEISGPCGDRARLEAEAGDQTSTESGHVGAREEGCDQRRPADFVWIQRKDRGLVLHGAVSGSSGSKRRVQEGIPGEVETLWSPAVLYGRFPEIDDSRRSEQRDCLKGFMY